ncbi:DUF1430 domain-containing protein [Paenibacillus sp. MMS18-CY102]|uniref:DUF1430 domain-containing protein n=1 Tax=Paenibacillus sp. MMS18-CY102 TaxID=2682849 RepID=UPI001365AED0|nr:hypothetical protein [Paenibacillus sp. MMS18-CY102]MWC27096.1 hypothetical protein [Paenibacillus sp. MMS18-CY102]
MKTIKYIISFFILFVGLLIIGESHTFRLNNFYTAFDSTTLYLQPNTTEEEMIQDTLQSARRNNVEVFTYTMQPRSANLTEFEIYATTGVQAYFKKNLDIVAKEYPSLLLGNISFKFHELSSLKDVANVHDYYVIGSHDKAKQFKIDLINKYAGNHPIQGYESNELRNTIIGIWVLIIAIILLLSFYDVIYQKKESLIRVSMGEPISRIVWKNIAYDSIGFILIFGLIVYTLSNYTHVYFEFKLSLLFLLILLVTNALLYVNLYFYNLKEVFSNAKASSNKLLTLNYGLKFVTIVITILVISGNIALMIESYQLYKQKSFFEDHKDYSYIRLAYKPLTSSDGTVNFRDGEKERVNYAFYKQFFEKSDGILLSTTEGMTKNRGGIYANRNALGYLSGKIDKIKNMELTKDIYFFLPKKRSTEAGVLDELKLTVRQFEGDQFSYTYDIIYYESNIEMLRINEDSLYGSELIENPTVIYNNLPANKLGSHPKFTYHSTEIMYNITDQEFNQFVQNNQLSGLSATKTNVLDYFNKGWNAAKRILYMNLIFSMLVLFLEFIIISSIIKLEYEVNAIELSIKKVLGYSVCAKNRKIILMTIITTILSIISAVIAALLSGLHDVQYLAAGGIVILVLELAVIGFRIRRIENVMIQKILKGGGL